VASAVLATSVVPMNLRRVSMIILPDATLFGRVSSCEDRNLDTVKRKPDPRAFGRGNRRYRHSMRLRAAPAPR